MHACARPCTGVCQWKFGCVSECVFVFACEPENDSVGCVCVWRPVWERKKKKRSKRNQALHAHHSIHHRWSCEDCNTCSFSQLRKPNPGLRRPRREKTEQNPPSSHYLGLFLLRVWHLEAFQLNKVGLDPRPGLLWDLLEACVFRSTFFFQSRATYCHLRTRI